MSDISSPIKLTITWSNGTGFSLVKRVRLIKMFGSTEDIVSFSKSNSADASYFTDNATGLTADFVIERSTESVGTHMIKAEYSLADAGDWAAFPGGELSVDISSTDIDTDFSQFEAGEVSYTPGAGSGFTAEINVESIEYNVTNGNGVNVFGGRISFVPGSITDAYYIIKNDKFLVKAADDSLSFTGNTVDQASNFFNIKTTIGPTEYNFITAGKGVTDKIINYGSGGLNMLVFGDISDLSESNMTVTLYS